MDRNSSFDTEAKNIALTNINLARLELALRESDPKKGLESALEALPSDVDNRYSFLDWNATNFKVKAFFLQQLQTILEEKKKSSSSPYQFEQKINVVKEVKKSINLHGDVDVFISANPGYLQTTRPILSYIII